ncbi:PREDICTED: putative sodium-dependent multivitamin transporter [Ceratosolen solmsi marchali]|uniref:Sodium-dependent multivitamin transporter n=1 Tax=Ceratosolen solmsi marchali TaxID=326594 RepID=A0AAJ6VKC3_9HYME|nr:PREDICTED: putative sodium-dependent multivitamin transporter [Ceratosolen solmsi marchali]
MSIVPLGVALMVSFVSAISILGISSEIYTYGMQFVMYYNGMIMATLVVSYVYLPVFFKLNTMSVYEVNNSLYCRHCVVVYVCECQRFFARCFPSARL